ncbi:5-(carboxyamino)imidazole ribonucleotide synthase [Thiohalomonas denitrificans]|uniref:N5-carboxyaminoimidazole ribonucleotide synthase n=1 Tax=Thiohalomonas denitrificans TaxID=415747 RepID=A0A1G5Q1Q9_9GAMM|nr:5-(carboxyamino)imidazole ribonucleotide synthase [Thiohalomonas denitrificans]SCZ55249.1 5-(carboxyamino)imidazole ribonucleotide synthase [Thiohalomonas denitrificans]
MKVGIIGGGQLARMLALAGHPLGIETVVLDPAADACAGAVTQQLQGAYDDRDQLKALADAVDVVTYEFENVPEQAVQSLADLASVHPSPNALATGRDRLREKTLLSTTLGIPTAPFATVDSREELESATASIGLPAVLKTRTLGYDGKGQYVLRSTADIDTAWAELGGVPLILEGFVEFEREVSIIAARSRNGEIRCYPLTENVHISGILRFSHCRPGDPQQAAAEDYIGRLLESLDYVGVVALELFQAGDRLLANEMAPRVHNSGHWTIEGAETSQFENHLRAICGLPLGPTTPVGYSAMFNLIGDLPDTAAILAIPGAHLHAYGKAAREGRKVGHITVRAENTTELKRRMEKVRDTLST